MTASPTLKLALPKGRMQEGVFSLLGDAGIRVKVDARGYRPTVSLNGFETKILDQRVATFSLHSFVGNFKLIVPTWRVQPYLMVGPGAQYGNFDGKGVLFDLLDTTRWDFMLRTAIGIDGYITENWLVNLEVAPSIRFADYSRIPRETTDNVSLTVGLGVQYRF